MDETLSVRPGEPSAMVGLAMSLEAALARRGVPERPVVFACIGTDRSTGDALGPLVGQKLRRLGCGPQEVVGTLEHPLHALNLAERITPLLQDPRRPLLVAVDAALGASANVGSVHLRPGGLRPGQGGEGPPGGR
jgi:putative sporulation protein YyaC